MCFQSIETFYSYSFFEHLILKTRILFDLHTGIRCLLSSSLLEASFGWVWGTCRVFQNIQVEPYQIQVPVSIPEANYMIHAEIHFLFF